MSSFTRGSYPHTVGKRGILGHMPNFTRIHQFVKMVDDYNSRDDEDTNIVNLTDDNYIKEVGIGKDQAIQKFKNDHHLKQSEVKKTFKDARALDFISVLPPRTDQSPKKLKIEFAGGNFLEKTKLFKLNKGEWHAIVDYYSQWSLAISLIALAVSIAVAIFK
jgi:hypothetical protein